MNVFSERVLLAGHDEDFSFEDNEEREEEDEYWGVSDPSENED